MQSMGLIAKIGPISDGENPQTNPFPFPLRGIPFRIHVMTTGGAGLLELTQDAATDLVKELGICLKGRGSQ
jgi:hypothetical protein